MINSVFWSGFEISYLEVHLKKRKFILFSMENDLVSVLEVTPME